MWQDLVFFVGTLLFSISMLPSICSKDKPNAKTSISGAVILFVFALTQLSLSLYLSAVMTFINAILWAILFIQKLVTSR